MQNVDRKFDRPNPDEDFPGECEVPDEIDYWSVNDFGDFLPAGEPMAAEQY